MAVPTLDAFQTIADPSRRRILHILSQDTQTINALADQFDMSRPAVSKHIKILHGAGFIAIADIGRERHCTLKREGFDKLREWMSYYDVFWQSKLKNLDALLRAGKTKK